MSTPSRDLAADVETWARTLLTPAPVARPARVFDAGALLAAATRPPPAALLELDLVRAHRRTHLARRFADYTVCRIRLETLGPSGTRVTCPACARFLPPEAD